MIKFSIYPFFSRANSLNAIKILANPLIAIDPTCHRHKKIPSMPFSGIQGIGENFNGIQGINSIGDGCNLNWRCHFIVFSALFRLTRKYYILVGLDIYNLSANYNGRKHWSMKARNLWSFWSTLGRERSTTSTKSCSLSSVPNEWQLHLSLEMCRFTCCQVWELLNCECTEFLIYFSM